jgi:quinoprotein dehydrogenase-associated probable ABC transporter substrate-binding protein
LLVLASIATVSPAGDEACCGESTAPPERTSVSFGHPDRVLRISADPNNLPFTNHKLEGFENKIAELLARDLKCDLQYIWRAQRRGFFRQSLKEGECDLVLGVPAGFDRATATKPYYRSTYLAVTRKDRDLDIRSLDDDRLRKLKIGVQIVGDDGVNTPPAHALGARDLAENVVGFTLYGDYAEPNPPARIVRAVADGDVDVALVWGPLAGYFARQQKCELTLTPLEKETLVPGLRYDFAIALGVQRGNEKLRDELNAALARNAEAIRDILTQYGVPLVESPTGKEGR